MTEIYWIVSDFVSTFPVFRNIIIEMWNLDDKTIPNVKSIIAVPDDTAEKAEDAVRELYSRTCFGIDGPNRERPAFWKYHTLIENAVITFTRNNDIEKTLEQIGENGGDVFHVSADFSKMFFYEEVMKIIRMRRENASRITVFIED